MTLPTSQKVEFSSFIGGSEITAVASSVVNCRFSNAETSSGSIPREIEAGSAQNKGGPTNKRRWASRQSPKGKTAPERRDTSPLSKKNPASPRWIRIAAEQERGESNLRRRKQPMGVTPKIYQELDKSSKDPFEEPNPVGSFWVRKGAHRQACTRRRGRICFDFCVDL
ncbi:hypothetical protein V6N12_013773 [Hibiscus sabdariffa]|uniref:Uncharacterized protein n=1 Tax=Hibiscus sabdariffa TaxID=183260 RepID=A0ABR2CV74_9ROSI